LDLAELRRLAGLGACMMTKAYGNIHQNTFSSQNRKASFQINKGMRTKREIIFPFSKNMQLKRKSQRVVRFVGDVI